LSPPPSQLGLRTPSLPARVVHPLPASEAAAATIVFHTSAMLGKENGVAADGEQPNQGGGDEGQRSALIWRGSNLSGV